MIIRQATEQDLDKVKNIIDSLQVSREQKDWKSAPWGFFEYKKSDSELNGLINPYFMVSEDKQAITGFSLAYEDSLFKKMHGSSKRTDYGFILDNFEDNFLYLDMLAICDPSEDNLKGVSSKLIDCMLDLARNNGKRDVVGLISEKPWRNNKSISFVKKKGFERFNEVKLENGITLGAYRAYI